MIIDPHRNVFDVLDVFNKAQSSNHIFRAIDFDGTGTHIEIRLFGGAKHLIQRDAVSPHGIRVDINLVLLGKTSD